MKKVLALLMTGMLVISISGCSKSEISEGISDVISDGVEIAENSNEEVSSEFSYKMASIYDVRGAEGDYKNWMSFAIEVTSDKFVLNDIDVTNNGSEIDGYVKVFDGYVCLDDKYHSNDSLQSGVEWDKPIYTVLIKTNEVFSVNDVKITGSSHYDVVGAGVSEDVTLEVNCKISDITSRQEVIHGDTLFEIGGVYYVFNSSSAGVGYRDNNSYNIFSVYKLRPEDTSIDLQTGTVGVVNSVNFKDMEVPTGYELYYGSEEDTSSNIDLYIGLCQPGVANPDYSGCSVSNMRPKFSDSKGSMIIYKN